MSKLYPTYDEYMKDLGYSFNAPGLDDTSGSGFWYNMQLDRDNNQMGMVAAPDSLKDDWNSQYNTRWANWMRGLEGNNQNNYLGGTAGLVAPGYMGGLWDEKMLGYNYTPEQLAARQAFQDQYAGYGQISPEHIQYGPNGEIQIKNAGPSAGDYVIDNSLVQFDPTYGAISPLSNLGHAGSKGGHSDAFKALAPIVLAALGGQYLSGLDGAGDLAGVADASWGVNPATSSAGDFSLSGATAGSAGGGLYSGAGGVTGLVPGAGGVGLVAPAASTTTALLTPATAAAAGISLGSGLTGGLTAAEAMGGAATGGGATTGAAGSAIGRIFDGNATAGDWAQVLGGVGSAALGAAGSKAQGDAYSDVANKYLNLGQPYRDLLFKSYQPGFSMADQPDFKNALDIGAQAAARATSAKYGNPVGNPGAYADMQKYISGSLALPQLNTYRSQLGTFGNLGVNTAGTNDTNAAGSTSGIFNSLGYGLGEITKPDNPLKGILGGFKLNTGYSF